MIAQKAKEIGIFIKLETFGVLVPNKCCKANIHAQEIEIWVYKGRKKDSKNGCKFKIPNNQRQNRKTIQIDFLSL